MNKVARITVTVATEDETIWDITCSDALEDMDTLGEFLIVHHISKTHGWIFPLKKVVKIEMCKQEVIAKEIPIPKELK